VQEVAQPWLLLWQQCCAPIIPVAPNNKVGQRPVQLLQAVAVAHASGIGWSGAAALGAAVPAVLAVWWCGIFLWSVLQVLRALGFFWVVSVGLARDLPGGMMTNVVV
jgi:hypothetical protein